MNRFPADFHSDLTGFGGDTSDPSNDKTWHREQITKTPIILVHGNGASATHSKYGMLGMADMLKNKLGYKDAEIWAMDHLGEDYNEKSPYLTADLQDPHTNHINQFREFVDNVREYLDVKKSTLSHTRSVVAWSMPISEASSQVACGIMPKTDATRSEHSSHCPVALMV